MTIVPSPLDLGGRVVLVTGGAQGIGEAVGRLAASRGATARPRGPEHRAGRFGGVAYP